MIFKNATYHKYITCYLTPTLLPILPPLFAEVLSLVKFIPELLGAQFQSFSSLLSSLTLPLLSLCFLLQPQIPFLAAHSLKSTGFQSLDPQGPQEMEAEGAMKE